MNESPKEISPFDFEEEQGEANGSVRSGGSGTFLRWSIILTAISFAVSLAGSVMGNNVAGDSQLESIAFALNRFGMMAMLLGCIGIFAAFRLPMLAQSFATGKNQKKGWSPWWFLLVWNLAACIGIVLGTLGLALLFQGRAFFLLSLILPVLLPLILVMGIWQQGVMRAYWLGVALCFLFAGTGSSSSALFAIFFGGWTSNSSPYGSYPYPYSDPVGIFGNPESFYAFIGTLIQLVQAQIAGLICAGYVAVVESSRRDRAQREEIESNRSDPLQVPPELTKMDDGLLNRS